MSVPTSRVRGDVPADLTSFVGRRRELAEARRLLSAARLLTLTGPGGVGKTRLAVRLANDLQRAFADGVWLVQLAELDDPVLLAPTVAATFGLRDEAGSGPLDAVSGYLEDRQLLLVLDNCEQILPACAVLVGKLLAAAPGLRVLATSGQALGAAGEHLYPVPSLSVPEVGAQLEGKTATRYESVRLFAERAAAVRPGFKITDANVDVVARLCQRLDGIPLAIELAAVRLRGLSEEQILQRLDDRFSLLTGGSRAALPRQRTLRAAIDWTFDLCSAEEQALWTRLSAFAGGFDLEAAEAVCAGDGIARDSVIDLVAGLVDKSVLVREDGAWARYRLPETVRQYGKDQLVETGWLTAMRVRHRDYYQRLAAQADADWFSPRQVDWFARMHLEHVNERVALDFSLTEPGHARAGLEITVSLWNFWAAAGYVREGRDWLDRALALNPESTPARARALGAGSFLALLLGKLDSASRTLAECRELASELGDPSELAYAALFSGFAAMYRGDLQAALTMLEDALERHRANADLMGVWITLHELASTASQAGDPRAVAFAEESLALCEAHGAQSCRSYALWMLGFEVWRRGDPGRAAALMREATELKRASNDQWGIASCVEVLAWAAAAEGDGEHAARLLGAAQKLWHAIGTSPAGIQHLVAGHAQCEREARQAVGDQVFMAAFGEGADFTVDQVVAYALGERAGTGSAMPARDGTVALTRRERQIAELVARGLSNKDIAATLMIAVRTAETHVEHVLAKLGFTSRTQIATWVAQRRDQAGGPEAES